MFETNTMFDVIKIFFILTPNSTEQTTQNKTDDLGTLQNLYV